MLAITRLDATVGSGLLRIEARRRKVKCQVIFFQPNGKRASTDTMNLPAGSPASRVRRVSETAASLLAPEDEALITEIRALLENALTTADSQTLESAEEEEVDATEE
jgi:hypothetical protein